MSEKVKVLIVDDDRNTLTVLTDLMDEDGFTAITAADGKVAVDKIRKEKPDIVLMDIRLPKMDGYEVCKQIKEMGEANPKVVLYTAYVDAVNVTKARDVGADDFVGKTSDFSTIRITIRKLLKGKG